MADKGRAFSVKRQTGFGAIAFLCFFLLYAPIAVLVIFSFNAGTSLAAWEGFSLRWYEAAWNNDIVIAASLRSLLIASLAALFATIAATMVALATTRGTAFRGQKAIYAFVNLPLMVPEIVTGVALLILFASIKIATGYDGLGFLIAAHTGFCVPFAYLPIRARLETMDLSLETAAADLYATPFKAFRRVTFPLLWPAVIAGAMLAFVTSLDTVVITELVKSAGQDTLPTYMLGQFRRILTPEMNAISTVFLLISVIAVTLVFLLSRSGKAA
jgi:spermidine/putrescine transport system permease protein